MKWNYILTSANIWFTFDYGYVKAETAEEAEKKAILEIQAKINKCNEVLKANVETKSYAIEADYSRLGVIVTPEK